jgi:WD40 repeat protein
VAVTAPIGQDESSAPAQLHRFDVATGRVDSVELDPTLAGSAALVEPEGLVLVADTRIATFDLDSLEPVGEPFAGTEVFYSSLAASPDGSAIAAGGWVDLDLLALTDNSVEPLPGPSSAAAAGVAFLPGGDQLITADADGTVSTWTLHWDTELGTPLEPSGPGHVTLAPDGGTLATWGLGRGVRLYDTGTLRQRVALDLDDEQSILGVTFDPDSHRIAVLSCPFGSDPCPASLTLFDVGTGARQRGPVTVGDVWAGLFEGVDFTGDGGHLVTAGPSIRLWDAEHLQTVAEPFTLGDDARLPDAEVRQLRTTLVDGRSLVVGGGELGGAAVWEITDQGVKRLGDLGGNAAVGFTADGELITATGPGSFQLRDPFDLRPLDGPFITDHQAVRYHSTSDGLLVASGPWGAQLWDIPSRQQLSGVVPSASAVAASDGTTVYLGGFGFPGGLAGDQIRAVDLSADHLRERACGQAGRDLTSSEAALYLPASAPDRAICPITSRTR